MSAVPAGPLPTPSYHDLSLRLEQDRTELLQAARVLAAPIHVVERGRALLLEMQRYVPRAVLLLGAAVLLALLSRRMRLRSWLGLALEVWRAWPTVRGLLSELRG